MSLNPDTSKIWFTVKSLVTAKKVNGNLVPNHLGSTFSLSVGYTRRNPNSEVTSDDVLRIVNADTTHMVRVNEMEPVATGHIESNSYRSRYSSDCHTNEDGNLKVPEPTVAVICEDVDSNVEYMVDVIFKKLKPKVVGMAKGHLVNYYFSNLGEELMSAKRYNYVINNSERNPSEYSAIVNEVNSTDRMLPFVEKGEPMYRSSIVAKNGKRRVSIYYSEEGMWATKLPKSDKTVVLLVDPPFLIAGHHELYSKLWVNDGLNYAMEANSLLAELFLSCDMSHSIKEDGCLSCPNSAIHCTSKLLNLNSMPDTLGPDLTWLRVKNHNKSNELSEPDVVKSYHRASMLSAKVAIQVLSEDSNLLYIKDHLTNVLGYRKAIGDSVSMSEVTLSKEVVNENINSYNEMRIANQVSKKYISDNCEKCDILSMCKSNPLNIHSYYRKNICSEKATLPSSEVINPGIIKLVDEIKRSDTLQKSIMYLSNASFNTKNPYYNTTRNSNVSSGYSRINHVTHSSLIPKNSIVITKDNIDELAKGDDYLFKLFPIKVFVHMSDETKHPGWLARISIEHGNYNLMSTPIYVSIDVAINICAPTKLGSIPRDFLLDRFSQEFYDVNSSNWFSTAEMFNMLKSPKFDRSALTKYLALSDSIYSMQYSGGGGYGASNYYYKSCSSSVSLRPGTGGVKFAKNYTRQVTVNRNSIASGILDVPTAFMYFHSDRRTAKSADHRLPGILPRSRFNSSRWRWYYETSNTFMNDMANDGMLVTASKVFSKMRFYKLADSGKSKLVYKRARFTKIDIGDIRAGDVVKYSDIKAAVDKLLNYKGYLWMAEYIVGNTTHFYDKNSIYGFLEKEASLSSVNSSTTDLVRLTALVSMYKKTVVRGESIEDNIVTSLIKKSLIRTNFYGESEKPTAEDIATETMMEDTSTSMENRLLRLIESTTRAVLDKAITDGLSEVGIIYTRSSSDPDYIAATSISGVCISPSTELSSYASDLEKASESKKSILLASIASMASTKARGTDTKRAGKSSRLFVYIPEDGLSSFINDIGDRQPCYSIRDAIYYRQFASSLKGTILDSSFCDDRHNFSVGGLEVRNSGMIRHSTAFIKSYTTIAKVQSITSSMASDTMRQYVSSVANVLELIKK